MVKSAKITTVEMVDKVQVDNESRFDQLSGKLDRLADLVAETSRITAEATKTAREASAAAREASAAAREASAAAREASAVAREASKTTAEAARIVAETSKSVDKSIENMDKTLKGLRDSMSDLKHYTVWKFETFDEFAKRMDKQAGGFGNTLGAYVEQMSIPSIKEIVKDQLKGKYEGRFVHIDGQIDIEIDAWATSRNRKGNKEVFIFEIKSKYRSEDLKQLKRSIRTFREIHPQFATSPIYAFFVVAIINERQEQSVWNQGIHLIKFSEKIFRLSPPPKGFKHKFDFGITKESRAPHREILPPFYLRQLDWAGAGVNNGASTPM